MPTLRQLAKPASLHTPAHAVETMDLIFIEGFVGQTIIGIHDSELHRPQTVVIDVHAGLPRAAACDTDRIADTIDYGVVCERLRRLLHRWVRVKLVKPCKFGDVQAVGVQIERSRTDAATTSAPSASVLQLIAFGMVPGPR